MPVTSVRNRVFADCVEYLVTETFTLRCDLEDGRVLRSDGNGLWHDGKSATRKQPEGWSDDRAYHEHKQFIHEVEHDFS